MLFEKIISLGYILQMVMEIYRFPIMVPYSQRSSEVIPRPCEHTSSDEDCSSRITNSYYPQYSKVFRIACHGSVASNEGVRYFFNLLKLPLTSESFGALYVTNKVQSRA